LEPLQTGNGTSRSHDTQARAEDLARLVEAAGILKAAYR